MNWKHVIMYGLIWINVCLEPLVTRNDFKSIIPFIKWHHESGVASNYIKYWTSEYGQARSIGHEL